MDRKREPHRTFLVNDEEHKINSQKWWKLQAREENDPQCRHRVGGGPWMKSNERKAARIVDHFVKSECQGPEAIKKLAVEVELSYPENLHLDRPRAIDLGKDNTSLGLIGDFVGV